MKLFSLFKKRRYLLIFFFLLLIIFSLSSILFFTSTYFDNIAKNYAQNYLTKILHKKTTIKELKISLFSPQVKITDLKLKGVTSIKKINIYFGRFDFFGRKIIINKIYVDEPAVKIILKKNKILNYIGFRKVLKSFSKKSSFSLLSVSVKHIAVRGGGLRFKDIGKKLNLTVKKFKFDFFIKKSGNAFLKGVYGYGKFLSYDAPYIHLKTAVYNQIFSSSSAYIHIFNRFVKIKNLSFSAKYFKTVSNGIIYFKKYPDSGAYPDKKNKKRRKKQSVKNSIGNKENSFIRSVDFIKGFYITSDLSIPSLSRLPENIKPFPINGGLNLKIRASGNLLRNLKVKSKIRLTDFVFSGAAIKKGVILANYSLDLAKSFKHAKHIKHIKTIEYRKDSKSKGGKTGKFSERSKSNRPDASNISNERLEKENIFHLRGIVKFPEIKLAMFNGRFDSKGQINLADMQGKFNSKLSKLSIGNIIDFYDAEKIPQFTGNVYGKVKTFIRIGKNFYVANLESLIVKKPVELFKYRSKGVRKIIYVNYLNNINVIGNTLINNNSVVLNNVRADSRYIKADSSGVISYQSKLGSVSILINGKYKSMPEVSLLKKYKGRYFSPASSGAVKVNMKGNFKSISYFLKGNIKSLSINKYFQDYGGKFNINILPHGDVYFKKILLKENYIGNNGSRGYNGKSANTGTVSFSGKIFNVNKKSLIKGDFNALHIHFRTDNIAGIFNAKGTIGGAFSNPNIYIALFSRKINIYRQYLYNLNSSLIINKRNLKIKKLSVIYKNFTPGNSSNEFAKSSASTAALSADNKVYSPSVIRCSGTINFKASKTRNYNYNANIYADNIKLSSLNFIENMDNNPNKNKNKNKNNAANSINTAGGNNINGNHINIKGLLNFNLHIGGFFKFPAISGSMSANDIYLNNYYLNTISARFLSAKNKKIKISVSAMNGKISTNASVMLKKGYPFRFLSKIKDAGINYKKTLIVLDGGIYGSGNLASIGSSYIFSKLDYLYIKHGSLFLKNVKNIRLTYMNRNLTISGFKLKGKLNYFQLRGNITNKYYNLIINASTSLSILDFFSNSIINSSGFISSSAVIFGPVKHPEIYGYANIKKGLIETSANPMYTVSRLRGHITFNKNLLMINKLRLRLLNGFFSGNGFIRMKNFKPVYYHLRTEFNSAVYRQSNYFYAIAGGVLMYNGNNKKGLISGSVKIKKAIYDRKINFSSFLIKYKRYDFIKPAVKKNIFNPSLNIKVKADNTIFIKNNIADAVFNADLNILGRLYNPVVTGAVDAKKGEIYFRGNRFKLYYANLDFNNPYKISPSFAVSAYTHISQYIIRMNANGSLLNFNVNFSSTPPLSELSIVSMLALGVTSNSIYANSAGSIAASEAASAIGGGLEHSITGTISSYFGFKNLSVTPSYSVITHNAAPQVLVTKKIAHNLSVSYSNIISSQSSQSVTLTYDITHHISLVGEWENNELAPNNSNIYSEVGGTIEFHFRFY